MEESKNLTSTLSSFIAMHLGEGFISSTEASARFDITNDYVTRLCRQHKVRGFFAGRLWFVNEETLEMCLKQARSRREASRRALSAQLSREYRMHHAAAKNSIKR